MNQNNIFESIEEELQNSNLSREEKVQLIQQVGDSYRNQVQKEYENYRNKQIAAGVLEIGSAAIPTGGVTGAIGKKLAPKAIPYLQPILKQAFTKDVSRKITNDLANGIFVKAPEILHNKLGHKIPDNILKNTISGMTDGAVYGLGESLEKETNPLSTMATSATSGGLLGGVTSGISANIAKHIQGNNLKLDKPFENIPQNEISQHKQEARNYYNNYLRDIQISNKDLGIIKFGKKGGKEMTSNSLHNTQYFPELKEQLQNAKYTNTTNDHIRRDQFTQFHHLENELNINGQRKNFDHLIGETKEGNLEYYITKDITGSRAETIIPAATGKSPSLASAYPIQTRALETKSSNIIKDSIKNFNPPLWQVEQSANTINAATHLEPQKTLNNTKNNFGIWQSEQQNKNENIKQTSPRTFEIGVEKNNYRGYKNPHSQDNRIFSAEDIGDMTTDEFTRAEPEIRAQWDTIGIPNHRDLLEEEQNGNLIRINSYRKPNGTKVKTHFRAKSFHF